MPLSHSQPHLSNMSKVVENKPYNPDNKTTPACTQHTLTHIFTLPSVHSANHTNIIMTLSGKKRKKNNNIIHLKWSNQTNNVQKQLQPSGKCEIILSVFSGIKLSFAVVLCQWAWPSVRVFRVVAVRRGAGRGRVLTLPVPVNLRNRKRNNKETRGVRRQSVIFSTSPVGGFSSQPTKAYILHFTANYSTRSQDVLDFIFSGALLSQYITVKMNSKRLETNLRLIIHGNKHHVWFSFVIFFVSWVMLHSEVMQPKAALLCWCVQVLIGIANFRDLRAACSKTTFGQLFSSNLFSLQCYTCPKAL